MPLQNMTLSAEQILTLAPDAASAKAGTQQASLAKWSSLGTHEQALWGLCQGSGKDPYRAQIALAEPAFKCTCPSRKFPCKHGLGLYLLYAQHSAAFAEDSPPQWVSDWLQSRGQRAEKQAAKAAASDPPLSAEDAAAKAHSQQKRQDKRAANVVQGIDVLDTWLTDLAREGLAGLQAKPARDWDAMAARMVDAQAAGLAARIRTAGVLIHGAGKNWELALARELSLLALLLQSFRRIGLLPAGLQTDVKTAIGWTASQDDALAEPALPDIWRVCGNHTQHDDRISRRACYLQGMTSGRWALLLQFSAGSQALPPPFLPGARFEGGMHFYPAAVPMRAVFGSDLRAQANPSGETGTDKPADLQIHLGQYASALAANPFIEHFPMLLHAVTLQHRPDQASGWMLRSADSSALPVHVRFQHAWRLHSIAGGHPAEVFGLWDGSAFLPLAATVQGRLHGLDLEMAA